MTIDRHFELARLELDLAQDSLKHKDFTVSLITLTKVYAHVRSLITTVYELDRKAAAVRLSGAKGEG